MSDEKCAWCERYYTGTRFGHEYSNGWKGFFCSRKCLREADNNGFEGYWHQNLGCFITTAICTGLGRPDDCDELQTLRGFRDTFMMETKERKADVSEYYNVAPEIVAKIDAEPNSQEIYIALLEKSIKPAISAIKNGENETAYRIYATMVADLKDSI